MFKHRNSQRDYKTKKLALSLLNLHRNILQLNENRFFFESVIKIKGEIHSHNAQKPLFLK